METFFKDILKMIILMVREYLNQNKLLHKEFGKIINQKETLVVFVNQINYILSNNQNKIIRKYQNQM